MTPMDVVIKLREPITFGSETISELRVRPPKAKDIRTLPAKPTTGDILNLAGRLCGLTPPQIDEMGMADTSELLEVVGNFMQPGLQTGTRD